MQGVHAHRLMVPKDSLNITITKDDWKRVLGRLYSVQYKSIFGVPNKVRRNTCEEARPSRLDLQRDKVVLDMRLSRSLP
jgi:hypothetical protein